MSCAERLLSKIEGGRVLDVGCGNGRFTRVLAETLRNVQSVVGIDPNKDSLDEARRQTDDRRISYRLLAAEKLAPAPARFETVAIGYSLHHVVDPAGVLARLLSLLVPGGTLIVSEPCADELTPSQQNGRDVHHLKSRIDRAKGLEHRETYSAAEIRALVESSGAAVAEQCIESPEDEEPPGEGARKALDFLDSYVPFMEGRDEYEETVAEKDELRNRIMESGINSPAHVLIVADHPAARDR